MPRPEKGGLAAPQQRPDPRNRLQALERGWLEGLVDPLRGPAGLKPPLSARPETGEMLAGAVCFGGSAQTLLVTLAMREPCASAVLLDPTDRKVIETLRHLPSLSDRSVGQGCGSWRGRVE